MEVTVVAGQLTIDMIPGVTAPVILNGTTIIRFTPVNSKKFVASLTGYTSVDDWFVIISPNDLAIDKIPLGDVTNQGTWLNTLAGAQQAVVDLSVALQ